MKKYINWTQSFATIVIQWYQFIIQILFIIVRSGLDAMIQKCVMKEGHMDLKIYMTLLVLK